MKLTNPAKVKPMRMAVSIRKPLDLPLMDVKGELIETSLTYEGNIPYILYSFLPGV
jgi:hypothetical protein